MGRHVQEAEFNAHADDEELHGGGAVVDEELWTPAQVSAGEKLGWFRPEDLGAGGSSIASWDNAFGGTDLAQATGGSQPTVVTTGPNGLKAASFDGVDDYMKAAYTNTAGETLFMLYKIRTATNGSVNLDGISTTRALREDAVPGRVNLVWTFGYEGMVFVDRGGVAIGYRLITAYFAPTFARVWQDDSGAAAVSNGPLAPGAGSLGNAGGLTLGSERTPSSYSAIDVTELLHLNGLPTPLTRWRIVNYFGKKAGLW